MSAIQIIIQLLVSLTILNVWLFRRHKASNYRCADARNLKDEFSSYGFPVWVYFAVGPLKVLTATAMIISIWLPSLVWSSTLLMAFMMLVAVICHLKMRQDRLTRALPAATVLALCTIVLILRLPAA